MLEDRENNPEAAEAIDPPANDGGGGLASMDAPQAAEQGSNAIDPPANDGGGGG